MAGNLDDVFPGHGFGSGIGKNDDQIDVFALISERAEEDLAFLNARDLMAEKPVGNGKGVISGNPDEGEGAFDGGRS